MPLVNVKLRMSNGCRSVRDWRTGVGAEKTKRHQTEFGLSGCWTAAMRIVEGEDQLSSVCSSIAAGELAFLSEYGIGEEASCSGTQYNADRRTTFLAYLLPTATVLQEKLHYKTVFIHRVQASGFRTHKWSWQVVCWSISQMPRLLPPWYYTFHVQNRLDQQSGHRWENNWTCLDMFGVLRMSNPKFTRRELLYNTIFR